jgi:hypothetical protein
MAPIVAHPVQVAARIDKGLATPHASHLSWTKVLQPGEHQRQLAEFSFLP